MSIPIFTTQLEKSREATDIANVRSAYAKVMECAFSDLQQSSGDVLYNGGRYYTTVSLVQKTNNWQMKMPIQIDGVSSTDGFHWIGIPAAEGSCTVSYSEENGTIFAWNFDFFPIFSMKQDGNADYKENNVA